MTPTTPDLPHPFRTKYGTAYCDAPSRLQIVRELDRRGDLPALHRILHEDAGGPLQKNVRQRTEAAIRRLQRAQEGGTHPVRQIPQSNQWWAPPPPTRYDVLNLGAGVQSSCLALMAAGGDVTPLPDFAVFADTGAEPKSVYRWLDQLEQMLPFPVYRVTAGNLAAAALKVHHRQRDGKPYLEALIPAFTKNPDGSAGIVPRQCTNHYKIRPCDAEIRRRCDVRRGQKEVTVTQWFGISADEIQRMRKSRHRWGQNRYPLVEFGMKRQDCHKWLAERGFEKPPRSACVFCPYRRRAEWRKLRAEEPEAFAEAVRFDAALRNTTREVSDFSGTLYLTDALVPLRELDLDDTSSDQRELWEGMNNECEGMCGV